MAYNTPTDNTEDENRINSSTGISGFTRKENRTSKKTQGELFKQFLGHKEKQKLISTGQFKGRVVEIKKTGKIELHKPKGIGKGGWKKLSYVIKQQQKLKPKNQGLIGGFLQLKRRTGKLPIQDRIKVLRFQNSLEKARLRNQIERLRLNKRVENLRKQGVLKQVSTMPVRRVPINLYPAFATSEVMNDIDSAFNRDLSGMNDFWGNEEFLGGEDYYGEDYYGEEFSNSPFEHLNLMPKNGVSPLLW